MQKDYLSLLNEQQKQAVEHFDSPLLILAGAGSGKTRVITTKIAYLIQEKNINPYSILAVTFTKKAATEMKERAILLESSSENSMIRTFHSFGSWFLRRYGKEAGVDPSFTVFDDDDMVSLINSAVPSLSKKMAAKAAHKIALAKDYCLSSKDDLSLIDPSGDLNEIYSAYQKKILLNGNVDFGDLIMMPVNILNNNEKIRAQLNYRFDVVMVDEYQDSNVAQFKLLKALTGKNTYVCVVGDDDQSIYKFRGAEVQNIINFPNEFENTKIIRLERNYRSTEKILLCADAVVKHNEGRLGKTLIADKGEGTTPTLAFLDNQEDEAKYCADLIIKSVKLKTKETNYGDWAVLYRTNAQSLSFEKKFRACKIPYVLVGSLRFYEREEIKDMLSYLSLLVNPKNELAFKRIVNKPARGIGNKSQEKIIDLAQSSYGGLLEDLNLLNAAKSFIPKLSKKAGENLEKFCLMIEDLKKQLEDNQKKDEELSEENNLGLIVNKISESFGIAEYYQERDEIDGTNRVLNIQELINDASKHKNTTEGLIEFLDSIELDKTSSEEDENSKGNKVTLITLHNTKGLEFKNVIITGLENGIFPREEKTGEDLEEERRIFYVGITRAKEELFITSCKLRKLYGKTEVMMPSRFLIEAGDVFNVIGKQPLVYKYRGKLSEEIDNQNINELNASIFSKETEELEDDEKSLLMKKFKKGTKLYHDDWGTGYIINSKIVEEEVIIEVKFETGAIKKFMPQYQSHSLEILRD